MPLYPPADSPLTSPVYFGLRLHYSSVRTPGLLRAHLQTVRQTLQCDFIVIPTAAAFSTVSSERNAALRANYSVKALAKVEQNYQATDITHVLTDINPRVPEPATTCEKSCPPSGEDIASLIEKDECNGIASEKNSCTAEKPYTASRNKGDYAVSSFEATPSLAEACVLVESPPFATARAAVPVQHLAQAAADFPAFCKNFLTLATPHHESNTCRDGNNKPKVESHAKSPSRATTEPTFCALDGGLAPSPAAYAFEPSTESDLALDSQTWNAAVVCELSSWISPDSGVLPGRRKVVIPSPYLSKITVDSRPSVPSPAFIQSASSATAVETTLPSSPSRAGFPAVKATLPSSSTPTGAYSVTFAASLEPAATAVRAGEDAAAAAAARSAAGPFGAQVEDETDAQKGHTHYSKRSKTTTGGGLQPLHTKDEARESNGAAREAGQLQNRAQTGQRDCIQAPYSQNSSDATTIGCIDSCKKSNDCKFSSARKPSATFLSQSCEASVSPPCAPSCFPGTRAVAAAAPETPAGSDSNSTIDAVRSIPSGSVARRTARREVQMQLQQGLLRHWSFHETAWQREMQWATHVGAFAVITPPPVPTLIPVEYSRLLRAALNQLQPPTIWVRLPLVSGTKCTALFTTSCGSRRSSDSYSDDDDADDGDDGKSKSECDFDCSNTRHAKKGKDSWQLWQCIQSMVGPHPSLGLCLEITPDLPDSDSELERWFAEPLRAVTLSPSLFTTASSKSTSCCCSSSSSAGFSESVGDTICSQQRKKEEKTDARVAAAAAAPMPQASAFAGVPGVRLSIRHYLFLMKCAQHRVKIIFQSDDDNNEEGNAPASQQSSIAVVRPSEGGGGTNLSELLPPVAATERGGATIWPAAAAAAKGGDAVENNKAYCEDREKGRHLHSHVAGSFPPLSAAAVHASASRVKGRCMTFSYSRGTGSSESIGCVGSSTLSLMEMQPYILYVAQQLLQLPALKQTELFSAPYRDVLQSPMQPLADNLSAVNYEVFEKDPVKYLRYKEATLLRLREIWPATSTEQQQQQELVGGHSHLKREEKLVCLHQQTRQLREELSPESQQRRDAAAAPTGRGASSFTVDHSLKSLEAQRRRKKSRSSRRRRGAEKNSVHSRYSESDNNEEGKEEEYAAAAAAGTPHDSSSAACGSSSAFPPFSCSTAFPPPPPSVSAPPPSFPSLNNRSPAFDWCLKGAYCEKHAATGPRLVLTVVGAGRGPLVQAALEALREAGIPLCRARVFAVEKNWNAVITLRSRVRSDTCAGWRAVEVVEADMREAGDCVAEKADILISELLGSFGDNELSVECLDGAQMRLLKRGGVSIPSAYVSSLEPVASHTLWQAIDSYNDPKQFECAYVVNMFAKYFPAKEGPKECFHFRHPHFLLPFGDDDDDDDDGDDGDDMSSSAGDGNRCAIGATSDSGRRKNSSDASDSRRENSTSEERECRRSSSNSRKDKCSGRTGGHEGRDVGRREGAAMEGNEYERVKMERTATTVRSTCREDGNSDAVGVVAEKITLQTKEAAKCGGAGGRKETVASAWASRKQQNTHAAVRMDITTATGAPVQASTGTKRIAAVCGAGSSGELCTNQRKKNVTLMRKHGVFHATQLTALRHRRTRLSWRMQTDTVVHGLAGYFHCCLYKSVFISIDPRSFSEGMFSWFPLFLPFRQPVYVRRNKTLEVYVARDGDEHKVWYEWAVLQPTTSEIYNHMGKHYHIGK